GVQSSCRCSPRLSRAKVDAGRPLGSSLQCFLCIGFWGVRGFGNWRCGASGAVSSFGKCGLPCGLRGALCPLHLVCSALLPPLQIHRTIVVYGKRLPGAEGHITTSSKLR